MPRRSEPVSIQSPPISEFKKKRSCLKRTCFSGCGCLFTFVVGFVLLLQLTAPAKPRVIEALPADLHEHIFLYDEDYIVKKTFLPAEQKGRMMEAATFLPKLVLSPILLTFDQYNSLDNTDRSLTWENMVAIANESVTDRDDTTSIFWENLPAEPDFVIDYYSRKLEENNLTIDLREDTPKRKRLLVSSENFYGVITIDDIPKDPGTSAMTFVIYTPPES